MDVKLNINLLNSLDLTMWEAPDVISTVDDIRELCTEFGSAIRILDTGWNQEINNTVQVMKSTIDDVKIQVAMGNYTKDEKRFVITMINRQLASYDKLITKAKQDWVELGYNPARSPRRIGRRRG